MIKYRKVSPELKETMKAMSKKGLTQKAIGNVLGLSQSTVMYHLDEKQRLKAIERAKKNKQQRIKNGTFNLGDRKEYNRNYQNERYNNDPEFRERVKKSSRESQMKRYWEQKNGTK